MNKPDLIVWSAIFARTNMGQEMPKPDEIRCYRTSARPNGTFHGASLGAMVNMVCAQFIETDDDFHTFVAEAHGWMSTLRDKDIDYIFKTWPYKRAPWEASE